MAKKNTIKSQPKKLRRTSTMVKAVAEGEKYLSATTKYKSKRTRTMAQVIKEGQAMLGRRRILRPAKKAQLKNEPQSKAPVKGKKQKKITKSASSKKVSSGSAKKTKSIKAVKALPTKPAKKSLPAVSHSVSSAPINVKKTVFKTKSKDHLPLPAFGFIDVCFCIDATGSMSSELGQAQSTILSIINNIEKKVRTEGLTLRFAIVSYRDHPPQQKSYVTQALDFTDGHEAGQYVNKLVAFGGGDEPEAVHDGLLHCCRNLNWVQLPGTPILRYIFHIADAQPHGKQFGNTHEAFGCLCGKQTSEIFDEINKKQIHYRLIKARTTGNLNTMESQFKKGIVDFQSVNLSNAKQMDVKVSDMIIQEVVPNGY